MAGLSKEDLKIIDERLAKQKSQILEKISKDFDRFHEKFHTKIGSSFKLMTNGISSLQKTTENLTKEVIEAKTLSDKTYYLIKGNGVKGLETQIKDNRTDIERIEDELKNKEKEEIELEKKKLIEIEEEEKEEKIIIESRRKNNKQIIVALIIAILGSTVLSNIVDYFFIKPQQIEQGVINELNK